VNKNYHPGLSRSKIVENICLFLIALFNSLTEIFAVAVQKMPQNNRLYIRTCCDSQKDVEAKRLRTRTITGWPVADGV